MLEKICEKSQIFSLFYSKTDLLKDKLRLSFIFYVNSINIFMEISATINRFDIVKYNIYFTFKFKIIRILLILLILLSCVSSFLKVLKLSIDQGSLSWKTSITAFLSSIIPDILFTVILFIACILISSAVVINMKGVLGRHQFIIEDEGFREITVVNDTLHRWEGIESITRNKSYIFVKLNAYLFHIIPKRAFRTKQLYEEFWNELNIKYRQIASN